MLLYVYLNAVQGAYQLSIPSRMLLLQTCAAFFSNSPLSIPSRMLQGHIAKGRYHKEDLSIPSRMLHTVGEWIHYGNVNAFQFLLGCFMFSVYTSTRPMRYVFQFLLGCFFRCLTKYTRIDLLTFNSF